MVVYVFECYIDYSETELLIVTDIQITFFSNITTCSVVDRYQRTFKTTVLIYQTTRPHMYEHCNLNNPVVSSFADKM
jgi:hypothetical protein